MHTEPQNDSHFEAKLPSDMCTNVLVRVSLCPCALDESGLSIGRVN